jgi:hypothetical protein
MTKEAIFRVMIRFVFLFAYGAFLWASIHHVRRALGFVASERQAEGEAYDAK